jgi:hypothetical protein
MVAKDNDKTSFKKMHQIKEKHINKFNLLKNKREHLIRWLN